METDVCKELGIKTFFFEHSYFPNAIQMDPERAIEVEWASDSTQAYPAKLHVHAMDRVGLLADITASISQCESNIISINTNLGEDHQVDLYLGVQVPGKDHLDKVMTAIRKLPSVSQVLRVTR